MNREKLVDIFIEYFGVDNPEGSYTYELTRVKEAFSIGTMTLEDFEEFDEEAVHDLADFLMKRFDEEKEQ